MRTVAWNAPLLTPNSIDAIGGATHAMDPLVAAMPG